MRAIEFRKVIDFADLPASWSILKLAADWNGSPVLLFAEGELPQPDAAAIAADPWVYTRWYRTSVKALHGVYLRGSEVGAICFERPLEIRPFHIQPYKDGWLLAEGRGGRGNIYDQSGRLLRSLDLGDAIEDIQTTPDGQIWVSYFDEGVFGDGIGKFGVVCFDSQGNPRFKFGELAEQEGLPCISDCYAMNVNGAGDVWLNYYTDFPLVHLHKFVLEHLWGNFGTIGKGFAVRDGQIVYLHKSQLFSKCLQSPKEPDIIQAQDESGANLMPQPKWYLGCACRGSNLVLNTDSAVYASL